MAFDELSTVRLKRALTADDGRHLPAGMNGVIVHVWPAAYEVEVHLDDASDASGSIGSWHLTTARPDDIELVAPPPSTD